MTPEEILQSVRDREIVEITEDDWRGLQPHLRIAESHETGQTGKLLIVEAGDLSAAVESPAPGKRVLRFLPGPAAVRAFVTQRLETYERMWNGCGCKIDYYR